MPDYRMVFIPHPVQLLTASELRELADQAFEEIVGRLTRPESPRADGAHRHS
jgi:hypothetical protein